MSQIQPKEKWKFLQKYWHKGAFFQETSDNPYAKDDVDAVYTRDYSAPTGDDKLDKSVLPKVMQVEPIPACPSAMNSTSQGARLALCTYTHIDCSIVYSCFANLRAQAARAR